MDVGYSVEKESDWLAAFVLPSGELLKYIQRLALVTDELNQSLKVCRVVLEIHMVAA